MLVEVASHLEDNTSLVTATHVCHLWRMTLLSSSRLWSHLDFVNEECALTFLERSKSAPLVVDLIYADSRSEIVRELLNEIATRATTLQAKHGTFLDELLARPVPKLEVLEVFESGALPPKKPIHLPSLTSLFIFGLDPLRFYAPLLTSFHIVYDSFSVSQEWTTGILINFFRNCPLLETIFLSCDVDLDSDEIVSLPLLRSFTHESPCDTYQLNLFGLLSLPSTCRVVLMIDVTGYDSDPWAPGLPTPRDASYLSDIRTIKITAHSHSPNADRDHVAFGIELVNSTHKAISFDRISYYTKKPSNFPYQDFLGILENIEIGSVETLYFSGYPVHTNLTLPKATPEMAQELRKFRNLKTLVLAECDVILSLIGASSCPTIDTLVVHSSRRADLICPKVYQVQKFAASREKAGNPLKTVTLVFPFKELYASELEELRNCVGLVKIVSGDDALGWDTDGYLLGTATHEDNSNGS